MAFFMVMWLVVTQPQEVLGGIADYFKSPSMVDGQASKMVPGGMRPGGAGEKMVRIFDEASTKSGETDQEKKRDLSAEELRKAAEEADRKRLESLMEELQAAIEASQSLAPFKDQLLIDITPEGMPLMYQQTSGNVNRRFVYVGDRLVAETENGARSYVHTDLVGTVRMKTDALGNVSLEDVRAPYGSTLVGRSYRDGFAFAGHVESAATALTYMKARYYDPNAMRFLSPDPVHADEATGANFNRYWYANNSPYKFTDPDGRVPWAVSGALIGGSVDLIAQQITNGFGSKVDWASVGVAAGVGAASGGASVFFSSLAKSGAISTTQAVVRTGASSGAIAAVGNATESVINGETPSASGMALAGSTALLLGTAGARASNATSLKLESMSSKPIDSAAGIGSHVAAATMSTGQAAAVQSGSASVGQVVADVAASVAEKKIDED